MTAGIRCLRVRPSLSPKHHGRHNYEPSSLAVRHDLRDTASTGRNHRSSTSHGFRKHQPECFVCRIQNESVEGMHKGRDIFSLSQETTPSPRSEFMKFVFSADRRNCDRARKSGVPNDQQQCIRNRVERVSEGVEQSGLSLALGNLSDSDPTTNSLPMPSSSRMRTPVPG